LAVAGTHAALLLSPRDPAAADTGEVVEDVIVLNSREAGDSSSVVVAVLEKYLPVLAHSLGRAEAFLIQKVEPAGPTPALAPQAAPDPSGRQ
jgi:hypothetical protein